MTPEGAVALAVMRARRHIERKEAAVTHSVEVRVKGGITVRVEAASQDDAEEQALEMVRELLPPELHLDGDPYVHKTLPVPRVRTVMVPRDIGDGCVNMEAADVPAEWTEAQIREALR